MRPRISLTKALTDPQLFGGVFAKPSFWTWRVVGKLIDGEPLTEEREIALFKACTGRTKLPDGPVKQMFLLCGRRGGGKDRFMSTVAIWRAALVTEWSRHTSPGEGAVVLQIGSDKRQAAIMRNYALGLLRAPLLAREVIRTSGDVVEFRNGASLEIVANDLALVRGRSAIAFLGSECCFWKSDESASSDTEVFNAASPGLAMCPDGGIALLGSSVYRKRGLMWNRFKALYGNDDADSVCWLAASRTMNPLLPQSVVDKALAEDRPRAQAEFLSVWREDIADFLPGEAIARCVVRGRIELPRERSRSYYAFADPSGGSSDSFTCAIGYVDHVSEVTTIAALREIVPPFSPEAATAELSTFLKSYGLTSVTGDRYAGAWPAEQFGKFGISYVPSEKAKTDLYLDLLPAINSCRIELVDNTRLIGQLGSLERKTTRGTGRDVIDHPPGSAHHDDLANVVAGMASLAIGTGSYDSTYAGFQDDTDADLDPGIARARRAQERLNDHIARISQPPQVPADLLDLIRRCRPKERFTNGDPK